jgi:hypothetical protein
MKGKFMNRTSNRKRHSRYGIDIKCDSQHAEADDLAHIDELLAGHAGRAFVFDRQSRSLLLEGSVDDVRRALGTLTTLSVNESGGFQDDDE